VICQWRRMTTRRGHSTPRRDVSGTQLFVSTSTPGRRDRVDSRFSQSVTKALGMAIDQRWPNGETVLHSDQGTQSTAASLGGELHPALPRQGRLGVAEAGLGDDLAVHAGGAGHRRLPSRQRHPVHLAALPRRRLAAGYHPVAHALPSPRRQRLHRGLYRSLKEEAIWLEVVSSRRAVRCNAGLAVKNEEDSGYCRLPRPSLIARRPAGWRAGGTKMTLSTTAPGWEPICACGDHRPVPCGIVAATAAIVPVRGPSGRRRPEGFAQLA